MPPTVPPNEIEYLRKWNGCSWCSITIRHWICFQSDKHHLQDLRHGWTVLGKYPIRIQGIHKIIVRFQKLTRNLFLTLYGHNVHRQQRQLSKFLMRYQQFASHAYCGAAEPVSKIASQQEKAFCVLSFEVSRSVITAQSEFHTRFRKRRIMRLFSCTTSSSLLMLTAGPRGRGASFQGDVAAGKGFLCAPF